MTPFKLACAVVLCNIAGEILDHLCDTSLIPEIKNGALTILRTIYSVVQSETGQVAAVYCCVQLLTLVLRQ